MKQSRILKAISYIALIILTSLLILSIGAITVKENPYYNEEQYFKSEILASTYMSYLEEAMRELIHNNDSLHSIQDGEIEIHYSIDQYNYQFDMKDRYFLIIYKNKALTNVELTNTTSTIESIKKFINSNENAKNVDIINGDIQSESDIIQKFGIQYLDNLGQSYYTRTQTGVEYIFADAKEFMIYSSYVEEFKDDTEVRIINNLLNKIEPFEKYNYFIIPISSILIVLILLYLIISIGYKKGTQGIALNDFDKIPLEIILLLAITIGGIPFIVLEGINNDYNAIIFLILTAYFLIYTLGIIVFDTIVKRIKSKTVLKSSFIGRILILISTGLVWLYKKYVSIYNTVTYSTKISLKVFIYFGLIIPLAILILFVFLGNLMIALFFEFILITIVTYRIIRTTKGYAQIEEKLKEMYEGNNKTLLNKQDFGPEFHSSVKYINDISNGFENAIQDRIKSEKLKAELITNVSHDIKTPLTSIINYVDLLKQENIQNEKAREYIGILDNKSQRLKKLTEDLVEASKVSTGNISLKLENINIVQLIKQALGEFEDKFKKRGLELILDSNETEILIKADNKYMYRIIENLFSNISKYALENSRVYVDIKKTQNSVIVEMKNISKDRLNITADELMQRFVRGDRSRTTEGSGLGISIAQNLTELQGGEFRLNLDGDLFKVVLEWKIGDGPFFR